MSSVMQRQMVQTQTRFRVRIDHAYSASKFHYPKDGLLLLYKRGLILLLEEQERGPVFLPLSIYTRKVDGTLESLDHYITEGVPWPSKCLARSRGNPELEFTCHFSYAELVVSSVAKREGKRFTGNIQPGCVQLYDYILSLSVSVN